ncbi:hypothetical protein FA15DRAFT_263951 [Coprinopsis marcescibilis]|uniref:Uncharacterized protein n=1 Tax=Coprinopsis marcescibilis TaxID=230819 RepID=A0A5C3L3D3_COPMA|nr:hypothetical protein FA15DRAFT_263951 [Coprinopsis marcescibilis]
MLARDHPLFACDCCGKRCPGEICPGYAALWHNVRLALCTCSHQLTLEIGTAFAALSASLQSHAAFLPTLWAVTSWFLTIALGLCRLRPCKPPDSRPVQAQQSRSNREKSRFKTLTSPGFLRGIESNFCDTVADF